MMTILIILIKIIHIPKTALNSPPPDAGIIIRTPLLVYLAFMTSLGIVTTASNGFFPSLNLFMYAWRQKSVFIELAHVLYTHA